MEDGRIAYRMKRPLPDGTTHLRFTGLELLRRLASLVPPPRVNLTRFHGVFAPGAKVRPFLLPQAGEEKRHNPRLAGKSREEFIHIMENLHLPKPRKIDLAVPANRACGHTQPSPQGA